MFDRRQAAGLKPLLLLFFAGFVPLVGISDTLNTYVAQLEALAGSR